MRNQLFSTLLYVSKMQFWISSAGKTNVFLFRLKQDFSLAFSLHDNNRESSGLFTCSAIYLFLQGNSYILCLKNTCLIQLPGLNCTYSSIALICRRSLEIFIFFFYNQTGFLIYYCHKPPPPSYCILIFHIQNASLIVSLPI